MISPSMPNLRWRVFAILACLAIALSSRTARAQELDGGAPGASSAQPSGSSASTDAGVAPSESAPTPSTASSAANGAQGPGATAATSSGVTPEGYLTRRTKPLRMSIGLLPSASDLGSEADLVSTADNDALYTESLKKWTFELKGYLRVPMRVSWGPSCGTNQLVDVRPCYAGESPRTQLHSPPRVVGLSSGDWSYVGLAPNTSGSLRVTVANPLVSANVIFSTSNMNDAGFMDLDQIGGISQAYVTLKFPTAFGAWGGLAWTVGAFSNRYGNAGPNQTSSGYYGTYLFGRTHTVGEDLTADIDLNDDVELLLEHGFGAKLDVIPYLGPTAKNPVMPFQPSYFQGQGHAAHGSNFLHHAHAGIAINRWLQFGAHYLTSWTPNDRVLDVKNPPEARLTVYGADLHLDDNEAGHAYIGYSHVDAKYLYPLDEALQVIHGGDGYNFKLEYFLGKDRVTMDTPTNDSGTVDTILFQYVTRLAPLLRDSLPIRDVALAAYGMFNHVHSQAGTMQPTPGPEFTNNRIKFGAEVEAALLKFMSLGFRYDRVIPDIDNDADSYSAVSPRLIFYSRWRSKEYVVVDYTHFLLGPLAYPSSPYSSFTIIDKDMIMVSATMSF
jgi:hypothetical protein